MAKATPYTLVPDPDAARAEAQRGGVGGGGQGAAAHDDDSKPVPSRRPSAGGGEDGDGDGAAAAAAHLLGPGATGAPAGKGSSKHSRKKGSGARVRRRGPGTAAAPASQPASTHPDTLRELLDLFATKYRYHTVKPFKAGSTADTIWLAVHKINDMLNQRRTLVALPLPLPLPRAGEPIKTDQAIFLEELTRFLFRLKYEIHRIIAPHSAPKLYRILGNIAGAILTFGTDHSLTLSDATKVQLSWLQHTGSSNKAFPPPATGGESKLGPPIQRNQWALPTADLTPDFLSEECRSLTPAVILANLYRKSARKEAIVVSDVPSFFDVILGKKRKDYPIAHKGWAIFTAILAGLILTAIAGCALMCAGVLGTQLFAMTMPTMIGAYAAGAVIAFLAAEFTHASRQNRPSLLFRSFQRHGKSAAGRPAPRPAPSGAVAAAAAAATVVVGAPWADPLINRLLPPVNPLAAAAAAPAAAPPLALVPERARSGSGLGGSSALFQPEGGQGAGAGAAPAPAAAAASGGRSWTPPILGAAPGDESLV